MIIAVSSWTYHAVDNTAQYQTEKLARQTDENKVTPLACPVAVQ